MRVSVLIPVYNGCRYIGTAIESILAQTFQDLEIIVVDDGSEDETASIVKQYDRVRYVYQKHSGVSTARNRALEEAEGELITFLDADDLILPDKLEKQITYMDAHPGCELVFCRFRNFYDLRETEKMPRHQQLMEENNLPLLIGALLRADLFEKWGGFNPHLVYGEDTEWLTRVMIGRVNVEHYIEEELYLRRIHAENSSLRHPAVIGKERLKFIAGVIHRSMTKEKQRTGNLRGDNDACFRINSGI